MPSQPRRLDAPITHEEFLHLEAFLKRPPTTHSAMTVPMIDGMLTATVIGPRPVMPSEYMPWIWDRRGGVIQPAFQDEGVASAVFGMVLSMHNRVARLLAGEPPELTPVFVQDERWSHAEWVFGFRVGMKFDPAGWNKAIRENPGYFDPIAALRDVQADEVAAEGWPGLLKNVQRGVIGLRYYLRERSSGDRTPRPQAPMARSGSKVGRNEPCPCGSGRKFKRCCGDSGATVH